MSPTGTSAAATVASQARTLTRVIRLASAVAVLGAVVGLGMAVLSDDGFTSGMPVLLSSSAAAGLIGSARFFFLPWDPARDRNGPRIDPRVWGGRGATFVDFLLASTLGGIGSVVVAIIGHNAYPLDRDLPWQVPLIGALAWTASYLVALIVGLSLAVLAVVVWSMAVERRRPSANALLIAGVILWVLIWAATLILLATVPPGLRIPGYRLGFLFSIMFLSADALTGGQLVLLWCARILTAPILLGTLVLLGWRAVAVWRPRPRRRP